MRDVMIYFYEIFVIICISWIIFLCVDEWLTNRRRRKRNSLSCPYKIAWITVLLLVATVEAGEICSEEVCGGFSITVPHNWGVSDNESRLV